MAADDDEPNLITTHYLQKGINPTNNLSSLTTPPPGQPLQDMLTDWRDSIGFAWPAPQSAVKPEPAWSTTTNHNTSDDDDLESERLIYNEEVDRMKKAPQQHTTNNHHHNTTNSINPVDLVGWTGYFPPQPLAYLDQDPESNNIVKRDNSWEKAGSASGDNTNPVVSSPTAASSPSQATTASPSTPQQQPQPAQQPAWDPSPFFTGGPAAEFHTSSTAAAAAQQSAEFVTTGADTYSGGSSRSSSSSGPSRANNNYWSPTTVESSEWGNTYDDPPPQTVAGGVDPAEAAAAAVAALHQQHPDRPLLASIPEAAALLSLDCLTPEYRRLLKNIPRKSREAMTPSDEAAFRTCHPQYSKNCYILMHLGYDIRLGESGRAALKKEISRRLKNDAQLREKCVSIVCRLKNANVLQLLQMAEISGCLLLGLRISSTYWRDYAKKQRPGAVSRRTPLFDESGGSPNSSGNNNPSSVVVNSTTGPSSSSSSSGFVLSPTPSSAPHHHQSTIPTTPVIETSSPGGGTSSRSTASGTNFHQYEFFPPYSPREKRPNSCDDTLPPIKKQALQPEDLLSKSAAVWGDYGCSTAASWLDATTTTTTTAPTKDNLLVPPFEWPTAEPNFYQSPTGIIESEEYSDSGPIS